MTTRIRSNWRGIDGELNRLSRMPSPRTLQQLDRVLASGFAATQAAVHIRTGSLIASGKKDSEFREATKTWKGEISYGGVSPGLNNPVDYAIYEQRRAPDERGDHDFMRPLSTLHVAYVDVLLKALAP